MSSTPKTASGRRRAVKVGDRVRITMGRNQNHEGIIQFIGTAEFATGKWLGIALDGKNGKNDGSVAGTRYFNCKPGHGIFVKPSLVRPIEPTEDTPAASSPSARTPSKRTGGKTPRTGTKPRTARGSKSSVSPTKSRPGSANPEVAQRRAQLDKLQAKTTKQSAGSGVTAAAAAAHQQQSRDDAKAERRAARDTARQLDEFKAENTKLKSELADTKAKLKRVQSTVAELKKAEMKATSSASKADEKVSGLQDMVENLSLEKEIAEADLEEAKDEMEAVKDTLKNVQLELQMVRQQGEAKAQEMLRNLPTDQQEVALLKQTNISLTDALRQLRDLSLADKARFESSQEQAKRTIAKLQAENVELKDARRKLDKAEEDIVEYKEALDEAGQFESMVEDLTEKNVTLGEKIEELEQANKDLKELNEAAEEIEESHQEYEKQLQAEVDVANGEITALNQQLKRNKVKLDDQQRTLKQFRQLTKQLQDQQAAAEMSGGTTTVSGGDMARNVKLQQQISELRHESVDGALHLLAADQAKMQLKYLQAYIPENLAVDFTSLEFLKSLQGLEHKAQTVAKLMNQYYGPDVAVLDSSENSGKVATMALSVIFTCYDVRSALLTLSQCVRRAKSEEFTSAAKRAKSLQPAETILENFLSLVAKDTFTETTQLRPLSECVDQIRKFADTYFAPVDEPLSYDLPRGDRAAGVDLSMGQITNNITQTRLLMRVLSALLVALPESAGADDYLQLFNSLEDTQLKAQTLGNKLVEKTAVLSGATGGFVPSAGFSSVLSTSHSKAKVCPTKLDDVIRKVRTVIDSARGGDEESMGPELTRVLREEMESKSGLNAVLEDLHTALTELSASMDERIQVCSKGSAQERKDITQTFWENHAAQVRAELKEAASLKDKLEESNDAMRAKMEEVFAANKAMRDHKTKIQVLQQRLMQVEQQAGGTQQLASELEKYKRQDAQYQQEMESTQKDMEKFGRENAALKQKLAKLQLSKMQGKQRGAAASSVAGYGSGGVNSVELDLLGHTIRVLRREISVLRAQNAVADLHNTLPPLPDVRQTRIHKPTQFTLCENLADTSRRQHMRQTAGVFASLKKLGSNLESRAKKLLVLRSAPKIVDISGPAPVGRQWRAHKAEANKVASDARTIRKKLDQVLAKGAVKGASVRPKLGSTGGKLVGRVRIRAGQNFPAPFQHKVTVGMKELEVISRIFV